MMHVMPTTKPLTPNRVKALRKKAKLTQEGLARESGVSLGTIQKLEAGKQIPSATTAVRIARLLNSTVEDIFEAAS